MKFKTIKGRIFNLNLITTIISLLLVAVIFNVAIRFYFQNQVMSQLSSAAGTVKDTFSKQVENLTSLPKDNRSLSETSHKIENSFNKNLSVINAQSFLVDDKLKVVLSGKADTSNEAIQNKLLNGLNRATADNHGEKKITINYGQSKYAALLITAPENNINIKYIVIFTSLDQINTLQQVINLILLIILLITAFISILISSYISRRISKPLSSLNAHIRSLSERKFTSNVNITAENEIQELVDNVNTMSEKLEMYDHAQKVFLQNASHEFRTPLMIIQSYAEGLKHEVVESKEIATDIIIEETKRLCSLVEDLLYLSRLDTDEEIYRFELLDIKDLLRNITDRMKILAAKEQKDISLLIPEGEIIFTGDEEKLNRAITNIITNCLRYAKSNITIQADIIKHPAENHLLLTISDDGEGFDPEDLDNIFSRFYKGKNGKFGLGLAIAKVIFEKHNGIIVAKNNPNGGAIFEITLSIRECPTRS